MAVKEYRYIKGGDKESQYNVHVREMIEMIKNEEIKENLYIKGIKLSKHAFERCEQHFGVTNIATATRLVKDKLKNAKRIGSIIAYDGRINVLYASEQTAFFLSPDLKTVVTVNKCKEVTFQPILQELNIHHGKVDKEHLVDLHLKHLKEIEAKEQEQIKVMLDIDSQVSEAVEMYQSLLPYNKGRGRRKRIKELISSQNHTLKLEGWKLFDINVQKRHICKSLVSLY